MLTDSFVDLQPEVSSLSVKSFFFCQFAKIFTNHRLHNYYPPLLSGMLAIHIHSLDLARASLEEWLEPLIAF